MLRKMMTTLPVALAFAACHTAKQAACDPNVMCTDNFKYVTVRVTDAGGRPILLDNVYTIDVSTGETIRLEGTGTAGEYPVLDDSYRKKLQHRTARFQFVAVKNSQRVIDEAYRISADCCHITKQSGKDEIVVR